MRLKIGYGFLAATIVFLVVALNQGGLWWAAVAVCSAVALWGTGTKSTSGSDTEH